MSDKYRIALVGDWLESESRSKPEIREHFTELNAVVQKELWHQTATLLIGFLKQPALANELLPLQEHVVAQLYFKLSPLAYVRWAVAVSMLVGGGGNVAAGVAHLEATLPHIMKESAGQRSIEHDKQAVLLLQLEILLRTLSTPGVDSDAAAEKLASYWTRINQYTGVMEACVYATYYQVRYELAKLLGNHQEYYSSALLYLTYTPLPDMSPRAQQLLASDIGLAALIGTNIYNFGELLQQPILASLDGTEYSWLGSLLRAFNNGSISDFNSLFASVKDKYPPLAQNATFLNQKLRIMTLMELVFRLPGGKNSGVAAQVAANAPASSSSLSAPSVLSEPDASARSRAVVRVNFCRVRHPARSSGVAADECAVAAGHQRLHRPGERRSQTHVGVSTRARRKTNEATAGQTHRVAS